MDLIITTGQLAERLNAQLVGPADLPLSQLDALDEAGEGSLTFIRDQAFASQWAASGATAALVSEGIEIAGHDPAHRALIIVPSADLAMASLLELMASAIPKPSPGIDEHARVHPTATVAPSATISAGVVIGENAHVGESTIIHANTVIGQDVRVGDGCEIHPCVVIGRACIIGDGCILHGGVVIGADGFGYRPSPDGKGLVKIPHIGNVVIGRAVEIGANSCVDRAKFGSTTIGDGTKIDNLVQIAHNCVVGRACVICGNAGLAGSVKIGDGVMIGGSVSIADNLTVGSGAKIAGGAGVMNNIGEGESWMGTPATPYREQVRIQNALRRIGRGLPPKSPPKKLRDDSS